MLWKKRPPKNPTKLPKWSLVLYGIALAALLLFVVCIISERFANGYNRTVGAAVRATLAFLTSWIPFSLAEILLYLLPVIAVLLAIYAFRYYCNTWRCVLVFFGSVFSAISLFFTVFALGFGPGYHTSTLDTRLGLEPVEVDAESLGATAELLVAELNALSAEIEYGEDGFSVMPYDRKELNRRLLEAYDPVCDTYNFVQRLNSRVKPVLASKLMSYTHITGVYSFYTGEANINVHFPAYTIPFTAAHELAHQRGIARENEANFIAFLVCDASEDPYIRYSGYLNLFEYVASDMYKTDAKAYRALYAKLAPEIKAELRAYSEFFDAYRDAPAAGVSSAVNDAYLKANGNEEGVQSYNLVVELAVAYFHR